MTKIEGYLVQKKLEQALREIVGEKKWKGREVMVPGSKRRWDMAYLSGEKTMVVEFDGDKHYWDSLVMKVDLEKDYTAHQLGYDVVRIPYWVQLTSETCRYYFGLDAEISQDFPHGFITSKIFPASYSEMGLIRFERELMALPETVKFDVIESLKDRAREHGLQYVLPSNLQYLLFQ